MILSMTGYGAAEHVEDGVSYALEIKSLNHRYLKFTFKIPEFLQHCESVAEGVLRSRVFRGTVAVALKVRGDADEVIGSINTAVARRYMETLSSLGLPQGVSASIELAALAALPGVIEPAEIDDAARAKQAAIVEKLAREACDVLVEMRTGEGRALREDLLHCSSSVRQHMAEVEKLAPKVVEEYHDRLRNRVDMLMRKGGYELEQEGLLREVAIYAERCDISEELIRLAAHLDQFDKLCHADEPVGRTMEFLSQELLREANTIASKSNNAQIAREVVAIKGLIDRLKEQIQNVE